MKSRNNPGDVPCFRVLLLGSAPGVLIEKAAELLKRREEKTVIDLVARQDRVKDFDPLGLPGNVYALTDPVFNVKTGASIELINRLKKERYDMVVVIQPDVSRGGTYDNVKRFAEAVKAKKRVVIDRNCAQYEMGRVGKPGKIDRLVADHWDKKIGVQGPSRVRFWESPLVMSHYNRLMTGSPNGTYVDIIKRKSGGKVFERGVSVGCGGGALEMKLVTEGIVKSFDLFELSPERIRLGKENAKRLGIFNKARFFKKNALECVDKESVDLVFWNSSLHHMPDVGAAVKWSREILKEGGLFYMNEYVGPSRFQWSDESLEIVNRARSLLPDRYFKDPYHPGETLIREIRRSNPELLRLNDPSEAADSSRILQRVRDNFPGVEIVLLGGLIYYLALSEILSNFDEGDRNDRMVLEMMMMADEFLSRTPGVENLYALALARKNV